MSKFNESIEVISERIRFDFAAQDAAREKAMPLSREVIRLSGHTIRSIHRHEFDTARTSLSEARRTLSNARSSLQTCVELPNTHFVWDAEKEFAEASITLALVMGEIIPSPAKKRFFFPAGIKPLPSA